MRNLYRKKRILFTITGCSRCRIWYEFIERYNSLVDFEDSIIIIDCTLWNDYEISTNPLIKAYNKFIEVYPTLFFGTEKIDGTNTRTEAEAWLKTKLHDDFKVQVSNPYYFDKECSFLDKPIGGQKVICN